MNAAELPVHGGNLEAIGRARNVEPDTLLDFSANVNPLGPPAGLLAALHAAAHDGAHLAHYPEPTYRALREALAKAHGLDPETIVIGNGGAALLDAAIAALTVRRALVPTPAFSEYRRALASRGAAFVAAPLDRANAFALDSEYVIGAARDAGADAVILNTPHNPSGSALSRDRVRALAEALASETRATIADEAFVDYVENDSIVADAARTPSLVAVRSLTKFFAVPALRVGFAVAVPDLARRMRAHMPSWPVTPIAARAIAGALGDAGYAHRSRAENAEARERLREGIAEIGMRALPSVANYLLVEVPAGTTAAALTRRAVDEFGIVLRDCTSYDGLEDGRFVRVAVRSAADNARLLRALGALV